MTTTSLSRSRVLTSTTLLLTVLTALLTLATSVPADAAQRAWSDPRGDQAAGMDIVGVDATNAEIRFTWIVRVADLERGEGTVHVSQKMANSEGWVFEATSRWRDGEPRTALFLQYGTLPEQRIRVRCGGLGSSWNTQTDSVRILIPTSCRSFGVRRWRDLEVRTLLPGGAVDDVALRRAPLRNG